MAESARNPAVWTILLGPGPRLAAFEPTARGLLAALNQGVGTALARVDDLALLLQQNARGGRLLLDADELPAEDLGLVRRFVESRPGWSIDVIGEDAGRRAARAVLAFARARWMAWPPDLAQLEELLRSPMAQRPAAARAAGPAAGGGARTGLERELARLADLAGRAREAYARLSETPEPQAGAALAGDLERLARGARSLAWRTDPPAPGPEPIELGALLEEQLAALTVRGKKGPRFLYRGSAGVGVRVDRAALVQALDAVLLTARGRAEAGEMIRVELALESGARPTALVRVEFPEGDLAGAEPARAFELAGELGEPGPSELPAARAVLEAAGGSLEFTAGNGSTLQAHLRLPAESLLEPVAEVPQGVAAAAEDPFA
jgi:hypothetical protein